RGRHTRFSRDWSSDVCSSDLRSTPCHRRHWEPCSRRPSDRRGWKAPGRKTPAAGRGARRGPPPTDHTRYREARTQLPRACTRWPQERQRRCRSLSGTGGDWQLSQYPPNPILWRCPYSRAPPDLTRYLRALEPAAQPQAELPAVIGHRRDRRARPPQRRQVSRMRAAVEKVGDLEEQLQLAAPRTQGIAGKQIQLRVGAGKGVEAEPVRPAE